MGQRPITVDLARSGRAERLLGGAAILLTQVLLIELYRAGILADASETMSRHASRWILLLSVVLQTLVIAGIIRLVRKREAVLSVDEDGVTFRGVRIAFTSIIRLGFYQPVLRRGIAGWYSLESRDGRVLRFEVHPRDHGSPIIASALDGIEQRSRQRWLGRGESRSGSLSDFIAALRRGAGGRLWRWVGRSAFTIQSHSAELNDPLYRWTTPLFYIPLVSVLLMTVYLFTPGVRLHYGTVKTVIGPSSGLLPIARVLIALLVLGWIFTALGVNALVLLMRTQTRRREALQAELNAARDVQFRLLPARAPAIEPCEVSAVCVPALEVGGDYYDFLSLPNGRTAVAIADVSGKGLAAALLMTMLKGSLATALQRTAPLDEIAALLDRTIRDAAGRTFVTLLIAELDHTSGVTRLVRAGHTPPLLVSRSGATRWICPEGPALGMRLGGSSERHWEVAEVTIEPAEVLVFYTDGVTEELNASGEQYGSERLAATVVANRDSSAEQICSAIVADVQAFRGAAPPSDDLTLVVLRRTA